LLASKACLELEFCNLGLDMLLNILFYFLTSLFSFSLFVPELDFYKFFILVLAFDFGLSVSKDY